VSGWLQREPAGVPARWLHGELSREDALLLCLLSDRADWRIWALWYLAGPPTLVRPPRLLMIASVA
jgi:hypothetical protein